MFGISLSSLSLSTLTQQVWPAKRNGQFPWRIKFTVRNEDAPALKISQFKHAVEWRDGKRFKTVLSRDVAAALDALFLAAW